MRLGNSLPSEGINYRSLIDDLLKKEQTIKEGGYKKMEKGNLQSKINGRNHSKKRSSTVETAELNDCLPYENLRTILFSWENLI